MASFKVGDRVRLIGDLFGVPVGTLATVTEADRGSIYDYRVLLDGMDYDDPDEDGLLVRHHEVEPAPREDAPGVGSSSAGVSAGNAKAVPAVGDTVRLTIEGAVTRYHGSDLFVVESDVEGGESWYVENDDTSIKSVEILKPAKPSVKDLPAYAIVKNMDTGEVVRRRGRSDTWVSLDNLAEEFHTGEVDRTNWAHLVPQESV